jgi:DNA-binding transcriptional regulator WhiA
MTRELGYNISKSGLNHRFRKIREIVNRIEDSSR